MEISADSFSYIVDNLYDGLYVVDNDRTIIYWNKAAERISGFKAEEVVGRKCSDNILTHVDSEGVSMCLGNCPLAKGILDGEQREAEVYMHHKDGHRKPVACRFGVMHDENGKIIGGVELFTDITGREARELKLKELEKMAMLDRLTELPNRNFVEKAIDKRFEELRRHKIPFGVLFMDIDHFKKFNDTYGHDVGDLVLKFVAKTMTGSTRSSDVFGRWGGEEFIGVLFNVTRGSLRTLSNRVRFLIQDSYIMNGDQKLNVTISIGATLAQVNDTQESLLKRADQLLYQSKTDGRNRVTIG